MACSPMGKVLSSNVYCASSKSMKVLKSAEGESVLPAMIKEVNGGDEAKEGKCA